MAKTYEEALVHVGTLGFRIDFKEALSSKRGGNTEQRNRDAFNAVTAPFELNEVDQNALYEAFTAE